MIETGQPLTITQQFGISPSDVILIIGKSICRLFELSVTTPFPGQDDPKS